MKWFTSLISNAPAVLATDAELPEIAKKNATVKLLKPPPVDAPTTRAIALNGRAVDYLLVRKKGRRGVGLRINGKGMR